MSNGMCIFNFSKYSKIALDEGYTNLYFYQESMSVLVSQQLHQCDYVINTRFLLI